MEKLVMGEIYGHESYLDMLLSILQFETYNIHWISLPFRVYTEKRIPRLQRLLICGRFQGTDGKLIIALINLFTLDLRIKQIG